MVVGESAEPWEDMCTDVSGGGSSEGAGGNAERPAEHAWHRTCRVGRRVEQGLQQLHVFDVVDVDRLLQADDQPLHR